MLLYQLLEVNPEKRIGSNEAYDHPYISEKLDDILEQMQTIENPNIEDKISKIKDNFQSKKLREKHLEQKRSQEIFEDVKNFQTTDGSTKIIQCTTNFLGCQSDELKIKS